MLSLAPGLLLWVEPSAAWQTMPIPCFGIQRAWHNSQAVILPAPITLIRRNSITTSLSPWQSPRSIQGRLLWAIQSTGIDLKYLRLAWRFVAEGTTRPSLHMGDIYSPRDFQRDYKEYIRSTGPRSSNLKGGIRRGSIWI